MFADLDETIRQMLIQRGHLDSGEVDIVFDMPTRDWAAGITRPTVNLYLYDIRENLDLKDPTPWRVRPGPNNTAVKSRPDFRVDLSYNITAFASEVEDEHRLLARVLLTLLQNPMLPADLLQGQLVNQEIPAFAAHPAGIIQSPADYWGALDNDIKPAIDYRLILRLDLQQEISVGLVLSSQLRVGYQANGNGLANAEELLLQIGGRIHQKENPEQGISGVTVTLLERGLDALTDGQGRFRFSRVPRGRYTLAISVPGMEEQRAELAVPSNSYEVGI